VKQDIYVVIEHLQGQVADISYVMLAAGRVLTQEIGGDLVGVLLGNNSQGLASNLNADKVLLLEHAELADFTSDAYVKTLTELIEKEEPRAVLFGSTSIGADIAGILSAKLELPLVGFCRNFETGGKFMSQICGGKIMVEGELPDQTTLVTMIPGGYKPEEGQTSQTPDISTLPPPDLKDLSVSLSAYLEPDISDVDISKEPILISVGRGVQTEDNIELAEELAELLEGTVSASRPIVDQGWLPTSRMVGKSGKSVKPKLYLALGISGAPEHVEGITDSGTIIAINMDPTAPIFDVAQYGAEIDLFDLIDVLIEEVEEAMEG
jgi:electron transfer flavoprotein alpha subunit